MRQIIPHSRPSIDESDIQKVLETVQSGMIAEGELCAQLETQFAAYHGMPDAVATSSGTLALELALRALGVGEGDRVLMPTYICRAPLDACLAIGAIPMLIDSTDDYGVDAGQLRRMAKSCRAAIVPHMFGIQYDFDQIKGIGIPIVEDCAHAVGKSPDGQSFGSYGTVAVFSFHATKMMTTGEGGMVTSSDPSVISEVRRLKTNNGLPFLGRYLYPLSDMQAALGLAQLSRIEQFVRRRKEIADRYFRELEGLNLRLPDDVKGRSCFFRYPVRVQNLPERYIDAFAQHDIQIRKPVAELLHRLLNLPAARFPGAEKLASETISLPIYPSLTDADQSFIINAARSIFSETRETSNVGR